MEEVKKQGGKHFTQRDKEILKVILKDFVAIIENKKTDNASAKEKLAAWENVSSKFNISDGISNTRNAKELKTLWNNMIALQRNALTKEKQSAMATGGGPPCDEAAVDPDMAELVPHLTEFALCIISSNFSDEELRGAVTWAQSCEEQTEWSSSSSSISVPSPMPSPDDPPVLTFTVPTPLKRPSSNISSSSKRRGSSESSSSSLARERYEALLRMDQERNEEILQQDQALFQLRKKLEEKRAEHEEAMFAMKMLILEAELKAAHAKLL